MFAHALNYLTFQSFWISPGTSVLCWRHQPICRTLNFTLEKWIVRVRSWTPRLCFCDWKTNKQLASRPSMKERTNFSGCLQVLASQCAMKYCPSCLMTSRTTGYWSSTKTKQERIHVKRRSFTTICTYVALRYPRTWVCYCTSSWPLPYYVYVRKNSNSHVVQILIMRMRKQ